jgi:hypothetical protein
LQFLSFLDETGPSQVGYVSLYESITAKATELAAKMNEEVRQVMLSTAEEKQQAKLACVELTKQFLEEKALYEAEAMARAQALVDQASRRRWF